MAEVAARPYLADDEIDEICAPLVQHAAQVKHLQRLGMRVGRKPNGRPLVARSEFERAMSGARPPELVAGTAPAPGQPNRDALVLMFNKRGSRGAQAQK